MIIIDKPLQQFFDETVEHMAQQGKTASNKEEYEENATCLYRTEDGRKCNFGIHIPDSDYSSQMEGKNLFSLLTMGWVSIPNRSLSELAMSLQSVHDGSTSLRVDTDILQWVKDRLIYICDEFKLDSSKIDLITKWEV